jgi:hypothetical protein
MINLKALLLTAMSVLCVASPSLALTKAQVQAPIKPTIALPTKAPIKPAKVKSIVLPTTRAGWTTLLGIDSTCNDEFMPYNATDTGVYVNPVGADKYVVVTKCGSGAHSFGAHYYMLDGITGNKHHLVFNRFNPTNGAQTPAYELWGDFQVTYTPTSVKIKQVNDWLAGTLGIVHNYTFAKNLTANPVLRTVYYNPTNSAPQSSWPKVYDSLWPVKAIKNLPSQ